MKVYGYKRTSDAYFYMWTCGHHESRDMKSSNRVSLTYGARVLNHIFKIEQMLRVRLCESFIESCFKIISKFS